MNLLFLSYNNYFNRIIKKEDTYAGYLTAASHYLLKSGIDFDPKDGVATDQVVNWSETWVPDYVVCVEGDANEIKSRWFIVNWNRIRGGQYTASLKKDCIADKYDAVIEAPCFIEKAIVPNVNDPAIYNQEPARLNEIKKSETLIQDELQTAWIVGYMSKLTEDKPVVIETSDVSAISIDDITQWDYYRYTANDYKVYSSLDTKLKVAYRSTASAIIGSQIFSEDGTHESVTGANYYGRINNMLVDRFEVVGNNFAAYYKNRVDIIHQAVDENMRDFVKTNKLLQFNGKYIFDRATGLYYLCTVTAGSSQTYTEQPAVSDSVTNAVNSLFTGFKLGSNRFETAGSEANLVLTYVAVPYRITLTQASFQTMKTKISANANTLRDAPYKMFAIPYGKVKYRNVLGSAAKYTLDKTDALNVANAIAITLGVAMYDMQLLPYCPVRDALKLEEIVPGHPDSYYLSIIGKTVGSDYDLITLNDDTEKGIIFYPKASKLEFDINKTIAMPYSVEDRKLAIQCDNYRLVSPNGSADFQFNLVKMGGIKKFTVDCTYKPYNPYIHVAPDFKALYGSDFNDYRGLICNGEFSLPVINEQWQNYQINNKNYANIFNREIQSLELSHKIQAAQQVTGAISGTVQGVAAGAMTGAKLGSAPIGAIAGGVAAGVGGVADIVTGAIERRDQRSLKRDMYEYNIQNIQARPDTLVKTTALDANNKLFPYLEFYSCTDEERDWMKSKFKYDGMTIGRIDKMSTFIGDNVSYIKGQLIRLESNDDFRITIDIANEIDKGVYI